LQRDGLGDHATEFLEIDYSIELFAKARGTGGKEQRVLKP